MKIKIKEDGGLEEYRQYILDILEDEKSSYYFDVVYKHLEASELRVFLKTEEEALKDTVNEDGTLTEFRAYNLGDVITIFCTRYETKESVAWLFFHELMHYIINLNNVVYSVFKYYNGLFLREVDVNFDDTKSYFGQECFEDAYKKDSIHESMPEEKIASDFATAIMQKSYCREWWRQNILNENENEIEQMEDNKMAIICKTCEYENVCKYKSNAENLYYGSDKTDVFNVTIKCKYYKENYSLCGKDPAEPAVRADIQELTEEQSKNVVKMKRLKR